MKNDYKEAHKFSANHKEQLMKDKICGCFYCISIFDPKEIKEWVADTSGTAICPYCGIDSVIGESSLYPITEKFLWEMYDRWFERGYSSKGKIYGLSGDESLTLLRRSNINDSKTDGLKEQFIFRKSIRSVKASSCRIIRRKVKKLLI